MKKSQESVCMYKVALFTVNSCHWPVMYHARNFRDTEEIWKYRWQDITLKNLIQIDTRIKWSEKHAIANAILPIQALYIRKLWIF